MDTDDLSKEAYYGIIAEAELFSHDLTLRFGVLSYYCDGEEKYLSEAEKLAIEIMSYNEADLDDLFFGNPPDQQEFENALKKIVSNIKHVKQIPMEKRQRDF